jgi:hypothetical protein
MPLLGKKKLLKKMGEIKGNLNEKLIGVYTGGLINMVARSPVHFKDGGEFKNGWFLSVGAPSGKTRSKSKGGSGSLSSIGRMPDNVLGKKIYFANNTAQSIPIEYGGYPNPPKLGTNTGSGFQKLSSGGYSKQAPQGVARVELVKMRNRIKKL